MTGAAGVVEAEAALFKGTLSVIGLLTVAGVGGLRFAAAAGRTGDAAGLEVVGSFSLILPEPPAALEEAYCGRAYGGGRSDMSWRKYPYTIALSERTVKIAAEGLTFKVSAASQSGVWSSLNCWAFEKMSSTSAANSAEV